MESSEVQTAELPREYKVRLPVCGITDGPEAARELLAAIGGRSCVARACFQPRSLNR
jgi:hypothetical protein